MNMLKCLESKKLKQGQRQRLLKGAPGLLIITKLCPVTDARGGAPLLVKTVLFHYNHRAGQRVGVSSGIHVAYFTEFPNPHLRFSQFQLFSIMGKKSIDCFVIHYLLMV